MKKKKITAPGLWAIFKKAAKKFRDYKIPRLSASLAYYTVFSLAPLLVVLIALGSIFYGHEQVQGKVYSTLSDFLGEATANQLLVLIRNASLDGKSTGAAIIGLLLLLLTASTVFGEIRDAINSIWRVRARAKKGWWRMISSRLLSFSMIVTLGFLLLVSLAISALLDTVGNRIQDYFPGMAVIALYIFNTLLTLIIVTLIFAVIFRFLPDTDTPWRDIWGGAIITGILFMIGKFGISAYISRADVGATYGAAGALVILLVWVYYSAMILYFGAAVTRHWVEEYGAGIRPDKDAATTRVVELETGIAYRKK